MTEMVKITSKDHKISTIPYLFGITTILALIHLNTKKSHK